ncbi:unnamed protein product [Brassica rapa subsp. trilocularis]
MWQWFHLSFWRRQRTGGCWLFVVMSGRLELRSAQIKEKGG